MTEKTRRTKTTLGENTHDAAQRKRPTGTPEDQVQRFAVEAARLMSDRHCENVLLLDVRGLTDLTDFILIASGTSDRQIRSVASDVEELAGEHDLSRYGHEEDAPGTWIVVDFIDVVAHVFEPATRAHYDLEMLWGDAKKIDWKK